MLAVSILRYVKVRFTNPLLIFISIELDLSKFLLPLFTFVCSSLDVFGQYIHRLFNLSMVLRLKMSSLVKLDPVSSLINVPGVILLWILVAYVD